MTTEPTPAAAHETDHDFATLYREHFPALMRVAYLLTGSNEAAEDAVQDTFIRCRTRLASLDHPRSYLRAALVNECRSQHRRTNRTPARSRVRVGNEPPSVSLPAPPTEPVGPAVHELTVEASNFQFQGKHFNVPAGITNVR